MTVTDFDRMAEELLWLQNNPYFDQRPATIREFVGAEYLNIEAQVRPAIMDELETIFGAEVSSNAIAVFRKAIITGGIGIGKTTIASIVLPYLAHWVLCLKDPQKFFNLLPGSRIAFMQMSTSGSQAKEVVFGDIKARVEYAPWFQQHYPFDRNFKNQLRFEKDIWILPGDSAETTFEGYNILGGILDEADSHKVTANKDYAEQGYTTINSRIESRFASVERDGKTHSYGFLLVIGQMKRANGFAARKYNEFKKDPGAHACRMAIWESFGWQRYLKDDGTRDSFFYDVKRHEIVSEVIATLRASEEVIEIPNAFLQSFMNEPEKALRDLAGIPPVTGSAFISLGYKIEAARDRWIEMTGNLPSPVTPAGDFEAWFRATNQLKRVVHIDMAYSGDGDALGLAMGHVPEMVEREGEWKPFIFIDMLMRIHAPAGREIFIADVRRIIYDMKDRLKFKIVKVSTDGFQSTETRQQLEKRRIETELISVDKQTLPYEDLREAIYEDRIAFPKYLVKVNQEDSTMTEILLKELSELVDDGNKVDHPETGSKDVADAVAGVAYSLLGDRSFHRSRMLSMDSPAAVNTVQKQGGSRLFMGGTATSAPIPPSVPAPFWQPTPRR